MNYTQEDLEFIDDLQKQINSLPAEDYNFLNRDKKVSPLYKFIDEKMSLLPHLKQRVLNEYFSYGPLSEVFLDETISEILVNGPNSIWIEKMANFKNIRTSFIPP